MENEAASNKKSDNQEPAGPSSKISMPVGPLPTDGYEIKNNASEQTKKYPFSEFVKLPWKDRAELILLSIEIIVIVVGTSYFYGEWKELANQTIVLSSQVISGISDSISADARTRLQIKLLQDQIDAIKAQMRQDQRPWIRIAIEGQVNTIANSPLTAKLDLANRGKSPARNIFAAFRIEAIKNGEKIQFLKLPAPNASIRQKIKSNIPSNSFISGIMFFGDPDWTIEIHSLTKGKSGTSNLLPQELIELQSGRRFLVVHGIAIYSDVFGIEHWTKFCNWGSPVSGDYDASRCTEYNDVDSNGSGQPSNNP